MNTMKRILAAALALLLSLTLLPAFALAEEAVYLESTVDLPDGYAEYSGLFRMPDGSVAAVAATLVDQAVEWHLLVYKDLNAPPDIVPLALTADYLRYVGVAPDGGIVTSTMAMPERTDGGRGEAVRQAEGDAPADGQTSKNGAQVGTKSEGNVFFGSDDTKSIVTWFAPDGSVEHSFEITGMTLYAAALPGRRLAVAGLNDGIAVYDQNGNVEGNVDSGDRMVGIVADERALYVVGADNKIALYDAVSLQPIETVDLPGEFGMRTPFAPGGGIYLIDSVGLYKLNGASLDKVIDGVGTYFGDPTNGVIGLVELEDGTVAVLVGLGSGSYGGVNMRIAIGGEGGAYRLAVYRPMDPSAAANRKDFTVTALRESAALLKAVNDFQRSHPELKVKLDAKMGEYDDALVDDAIRTLNTDLLAGKGGDVLILDGLPVQKYAERGILADLTDALADVDLLPNILDGSKAADGKLYAMPSRFSFETLWGDAGVIPELSALDQLIFTPLESGQTVLNPRSPESWLKLFYPASEASFRDEQGKLSFDTPEFERFLDLIYELYIAQGEDPTDAMEFSRGGISAAALQAMLNGSTALYPTTVTGTMVLSLAYTVAGGVDSGFTTIPALDGLSRCYKPAMLVGVNARSENPEAAREFARVMFSEGVQAISNSDGLPVVVSSLDQQIDEAIERSKNSDNFMSVASIGGGNPIELQQPDENILRTLRGLCDTLTVPSTVDDVLLSFIVEETEGFFKGQVDAMSAAQAVQQRAWSYLNE